MIIVQLQGGLGNQMLQYAAAFSLAKIRHTCLRYDLSLLKKDAFRTYALNHFSISARPSNLIDRSILWSLNHNFFQLLVAGDYSYYQEPEPYFSNQFFELGDKSVIRGYFFSYKYFLVDRIRSEFSYLPQNKSVLSWKDQIAQSHSVSMHIRRGDYIDNPKFSVIHPTMKLEYYQRAVSYLEKLATIDTIFVFTDDKEWAQSHVAQISPKAQVVIHEGEDHDDLFLMNQAHHHIMANSTFSWWGAYLAERKGIVITPKKWFNNQQTTEDFLLPDWVQL